MATLSYRYRPTLWKALWPLALFSAVAGFFYYKGQSWDPQTRMIISGVLELNPDQAPWLFYGLMGLCLAVVLFGAAGVSHRFLSGDQYLVVDDDGVLVPGTLLGKTTRMAWHDIRDMRLDDIRGTKLLTILCHDGRRAVIHNRFLSREEFDDVVGEVTSRQADAPG